MQWNIQALVKRFNGKLFNSGYELLDDHHVDHLCTLTAGKPGGIGFLHHPKYSVELYQTQASLVLVPEDFRPTQPAAAILMGVAHPYRCFALLMEEINHSRMDAKVGVELPAYMGQQVVIGANSYRGAFSYIGNHVVIGDNVKIYPQVYIGDHVTIGSDTLLYSGVKVADYTVIGRRCILYPGAVIGSGGFGFFTNADQSYQRIPSIGNVVLADDVEIGANATVDAATIGQTSIGQGTKIDNLVQVAHNVEIGKHTGIAAQAGIAGSTKIGAYCRLGGQIGIAGHLELGDQVTALGRAGITRSFKKGQVTLSGTPAFEHSKFLACYAQFKKFASSRRKDI
ncbi:MAG: UDP-3-O-(3-hydroxymyristoyl)glucosamine N-acyltransferase [Amoebophilaceae bacterium]|nr:UDP-3-O-(3-hydroxymyristoyl)glucosamine N-acyltransferase [Amoebophilaceae bacterium]